jgi:alpha-beta hydrolase superfamily lysophospholipase
MQLCGIPELADPSVIAHWRAAHRLSGWLTRAASQPLTRHPGLLGLSWRPISIQTRDGLRLAAWVVEPRRPRGSVLLFHSLHHNRESTLQWSHFLAVKGCRTLAIDFRAHGESEGWRSSFGWWEQIDVLAAQETASATWPGQPLAAVGLGMGAAALCYAGQKLRLDAVVLHGLPNSPLRALHAAVAASPAPARDFLHMVMAATEFRLRVRLDQLRPDQRLADLSAPTLVQSAQTLDQATLAAWRFLERWLR